MKAMIIDNGSVFVPELRLLFNSLEVETTLVSRQNYKCGQEKEADFLVLSGGHLANTNVMENMLIYEEELRAIENYQKPILGICLGHQLIAKSYGGTVYKMDQKIRGVFPIMKISESPILDGVTNYDVFEAHQYAVSTADEPLISIAVSSSGMEIIKVKGRKILGFQFHPEMYASETGGKQMVKNFIKNFV